MFVGKRTQFVDFSLTTSLTSDDTAQQQQPGTFPERFFPSTVAVGDWALEEDVEVVIDVEGESKEGDPRRRRFSKHGRSVLAPPPGPAASIAAQVTAQKRRPPVCLP